MKRSLALVPAAEASTRPVVAIVAVIGAEGATLPAGIADTIGSPLPSDLSADWCKDNGLSAGSTCVMRSFGEQTLVLVGLPAAATLTAWRQAAAAAVRASNGRDLGFLADFSDMGAARRVGQALAEGFILADYSYKDDESAGVVSLALTGAEVTDADVDALANGLAVGEVVANAANWAKRLIDTPAGDLSPKALANKISARLDGRKSLKVEIWKDEKIADERLGGLLGVSAGSGEPARLVYATYDPQPGGTLPHVALVGKGITFDSGGLSLKTGEGMMTMKTDMTGAAVVSAVLDMVSALDLPVKVTVIALLTENMPGHRAMRPGDVLTIRNGMTIEVLNTDAEGRLVLADGLSLAVEVEPDVIIDVATLTGAQAVALGDELGGLYASTDALAEALLAAADESGEGMWRLPLHDGYESHIDSDIADMKNIGKAGRAGSISAALLLRRFTAGRPWAHFDIAGPGRSDANKGIYQRGATAYAARTIFDYLAQLSK
jgi:leucyl aminopeptidase